MPSPPYTATSPSYSPTSLPTSKKRPSSTNPSLPATKRRKASVATSTSSRHPLRQTSFPPEGSNSNLARSPSVESSVGGGSVSVARSRKGKKGDARSVVSGGTRARGGAVSIKLEVDRASPGEDDEDDEDDDGGMVNEEMGIDDQQAKEREKYGAFDWMCKFLAHVVFQDLDQPFHTGAAKSVGGMDAGETFCKDCQDGIQSPRGL
jgi:transcription initiation factor TFIID subunit 11